MKRRGFTLVELLVVIAIMALLSGILMPALARARQLAYRVVCGANLYGLGRAALVYAQDYGDNLPRAGGRSTMWGLWRTGRRRTGEVRMAWTPRARVAGPASGRASICW